MVDGFHCINDLMLRSGFEPESSARKAGMIGRATLSEHYWYSYRFYLKDGYASSFWIRTRVSITRYRWYIYVLVIFPACFSFMNRTPPLNLFQSLRLAKDMPQRWNEGKNERKKWKEKMKKMKRKNEEKKEEKKRVMKSFILRRIQKCYS